MAAQRISHIALRVESLRQAERFYARLLDLEVLGRQEAAAANANGAGCLLGNGGLQLALRAHPDEPSVDGRLAHICLTVDEDGIDRCLQRASSLGCRILERDTGGLLFEDVYGVRWRLVCDRSGTGSGARQQETRAGQE